MTQCIVLASGNKGKLKEFNEILQQFNIEVFPQSHFNDSDADETGRTHTRHKTPVKPSWSLLYYAFAGCCASFWCATFFWFQ